MDVALSVPTHSNETESPSASRDIFRLLVICLALFGCGLGFTPLANPDEARYGEIPREMLATGDFVTPRLDGIKYFEKPPLTYWLVAGSMKMFGFDEAANLDEGVMWPTSYAHKELTAAEEATIAALVKKAAS